MARAAQARPASGRRFRAPLSGRRARMARAVGSLNGRICRRQPVLPAGTLRRVDRHSINLTDDECLGANFSCLYRSICSHRVICGAAAPRGASRR